MFNISFDTDKSKTIIMKTKENNSELSFLISHQELIDGCRRGDQKAQFMIYKLYYKAMYNTSLRIVDNPSEAEDIMQESFLSAFEKIGTYSETVSFFDWLKKIVENQSMSQF
jgi:DNA-directed RNA polymerase specialized sigma24 family protein